MKTYVKLPIEKITTIVDWVTTEVDWPQMYEIVETKEVTTTDKTTKENFIALIANAEAKKAECIAKCDAEIAEYEAIITELNKL